MQMTNFKKIIYSIVTVVIILLLIVCMKFLIIFQPSDRIAFFATIIAIVAGVIAYITYDSIDSVKAFTNMDGNVLESDNYTNVYISVLETLGEINELDKKETTDKKETGEDYNKKIKNIMSKEERINDCIEFSIYIQHFIDNIIWLNFCDREDGIINDYGIQNECKKKIIKLAKKAKKYEKVNKGLENIFDEHMKLVVSIMRMHFGEKYLKADETDEVDFSYHRNKKIVKKYLKTEDKSYLVPIYNVCGQTFVNPITKVTFYNYLGNKFAEEVAGVKFYSKYTLSKDDMCRIYDQREIDKVRKIALLEKANENMTYANKISSKNMLWNSICSDNLLSIKIVEWLITDADIEKYDGLIEAISQTKRIWENMYYVFLAVVPDYKNAFITNTFQKKIHDMDNTVNAINEFIVAKKPEMSISK